MSAVRAGRVVRVAGLVGASGAGGLIFDDRDDLRTSAGGMSSSGRFKSSFGGVSDAFTAFIWSGRFSVMGVSFLGVR